LSLCVAASSPDGRILISHDNEVVTLWDAGTGRELRTLTIIEAGIQD